jgi:hypothetical protein
MIEWDNRAVEFTEIWHTANQFTAIQVIHDLVSS